MHILLYPFYSQYSRETEEFLVEKCCVSKINKFLAQRFLASGHKVSMIVPEKLGSNKFPREVELIPIEIPPNNLYQRLDQNSFLFKELAGRQIDLVISHHELKSGFLKRILPDAKIIQFNHLMPRGEWEWMKESQIASWKDADSVVFLSRELKKFASVISGISSKFSVWPMCYQQAFLPDLNNDVDRDIDILFVQRCSSSNYTHHIEFLEAIDAINESGGNLKIQFTDPTGYFETQIPNRPELFAHAETSKEYYDLLQRSKYAIALMKDDLHGGIAIREAIHFGAIPILLDTLAYRSLLSTFQYGLVQEFQLPDELYIKNTDSVAMKTGILRAIGTHLSENKTFSDGLRQAIKCQSFEYSWSGVVEDLANRNLLK